MNGGLLASIIGGVAVIAALGIYFATRRPKS